MNQKGFSLPHLLLGLVAVAIIGFAGWRVYEAQKDTGQSVDFPVPTTSDVIQPKTTQTKAFSPAKTKEKFQVAYPKSWKVEETSAYQDNTTDYPIGSVTFTTASNASLTITYNYGGKGGGTCEPVATDKPHDPNNKCSTFEYIQLGKLPESSTTAAALSKQGMSPMYFARSKYTPAKTDPNSGKTFYGICLTAHDGENESYKFAGNTPMYGIAVCEIPHTTLYYTTSVKGVDNTTTAFFDNADVKAFEKVLKTFMIIE